MHELPHSDVSDDTDGVTTGETSEPNGETAGQVHEPVEEGVVLGWVDVTGDQHSDDQTVNGKDTGHDDWDKGLHNELWLEGTDTGDTDTRLGCTDGGTDTRQDHGCGTAGKAEEWGVEWSVWVRRNEGAHVESSVGVQLDSWLYM